MVHMIYKVMTTFSEYSYECHKIETDMAFNLSGNAIYFDIYCQIKMGFDYVFSEKWAYALNCHNIRSVV